MKVSQHSELPSYWPADRIERRPVADLIPYANNSRVHTKEQIESIAQSIERWGWTNPVLIDEAGVIIAGHARVQAAAQLGIQEAPVMVARGWSEDQKKAYTIADNKLPEGSYWDIPTLRIELASLQASTFDISLLGFSHAELLALAVAGTKAGDAASEWEGMPEFSHEDQTAFKSLVVHFNDQAAMEDFAGIIGQPITEKTKSIWHPRAEMTTYVDKRYSVEAE
jgi:ParB-like chromosome segregation protein Spo0J